MTCCGGCPNMKRTGYDDAHQDTFGLKVWCWPRDAVVSLELLQFDFDLGTFWDSLVSLSHQVSPTSWSLLVVVTLHYYKWYTVMQSFDYNIPKHESTSSSQVNFNWIYLNMANVFTSRIAMTYDDVKTLSVHLSSVNHHEHCVLNVTQETSGTSVSSSTNEVDDPQWNRLCRFTRYRQIEGGVLACSMRHSNPRDNVSKRFWLLGSSTRAV